MGQGVQPTVLSGGFPGEGGGALGGSPRGRCAHVGRRLPVSGWRGRCILASQQLYLLLVVCGEDSS